MEISVSLERGRVPVIVLHVKGDIDVTTAEQLQMRTQQEYDSGARDMLIDLTEVGLLASAGLRVLHNIFNMLRSDSPEESDEAIRKGLADGTFKSRHLKLLNPNKHVSAVLRTSGYDMFLEIHRDLNDAIASF